MRISTLSSGDRIRIKRAFEDYDGRTFEPGQELDFLEWSYFPYEAGHTLQFAQTVMRLSENVDEELPVIRNDGEEYFERVR